MINNSCWGGSYPENDYRSYLIHHGIPGMRWGVRRFQNKDGSLTAVGKKRHYNSNISSAVKGVVNIYKTSKQKRVEQIQKAGNYVKRQEKIANDLAKEHDSDKALKEYDKKYGGKNGREKWLNDMYGEDWHNKSYMKDVFDIIDVNKHAKDEMQKERKEIKAYNTMMQDVYKGDAQKWKSIYDKYSTSDISKKNMKEIKKWAKLEDKYVKREAKRKAKRFS